jgi:hypothetical protein
VRGESGLLMTSNKKALYLVSALFLLFYLILWSAWTPWIGWLPESVFRLAPDSRLPKWFSTPQGYDRKYFTVKFYYYAPVPPFSQNFKAVLLGPSPNFEILETKIGKMRWHPSMEKKRNEHGGFNMDAMDAFPMISINTVDGLAEIVEQRMPTDILYISDDPQLRKAIETTK